MGLPHEHATGVFTIAWRLVAHSTRYIPPRYFHQHSAQRLRQKAAYSFRVSNSAEATSQRA